MTDATDAEKDALQAALAAFLTTGTITLTEPVIGEKGEIAELKFRRPRLGDLRGIRVRFSAAGADIDMADVITVAARLSDQPEAVISQLGMADASRVVTMVFGFFAASRRTGSG